VTESHVEKQVRLLLEQKCERLFMVLTGAPCFCELEEGPTPLVELGFTLLVFDYGGGPLNYVAFKTTLTLPRVAESFRWLLKRWESGAPPMELRREELGGRKLIDLESLKIIHGFLREQLPEEQGYALLVGSEPVARYIASGDRQGVATMIREELLPQWEAGQ
jgi:hypothetical protein